MHRLGLGVDASQVPHATAAVFLGVAVQKLAPVSSGGHAYAISLAGFRGGPVFPSLVLGAAAGLMASHLPGFAMTPAVAVGMGAGR